MLYDLRHASRTLLKTPAFTLTAVAALALGIGANTAIFSVVNQILLNPAGVSDPDRVVAERVKYEKLALSSIGVSVPDFADLANSTQMFESAAILTPGDFNYTGSGAPERMRGASVTFRYFDVFRAKPRLGRMFTVDEDRPNANHVVVLAYAAWKRMFGQDPAVLGRTIELNQVPYRIVGVMGPEFRWPANIDLWTPLGLAQDAYNPNNRFNENYVGVARLKGGVRFEQANALLQVLSDRLKNDGGRAGAYAKSADWGMFLLPFTDFIAGPTKTPMLILMAAVGFVLLIACSNIAGLMLARASGRSKEIAVRAALGAGRWHLIRQTLAETSVISIAGAVLGLVVAYVGVRGLLALAPENSPVVFNVRLDGTVLLFTALVAIVAGLLFGAVPAWQVARLDRFEALKEGGRSGTAGHGRQRMRAGLVIGEVALALVLLVGAGLFLRSLAALEDVNPGFQPNGVITGGLALPNAQYSDPVKRVGFFQNVVARLANTPGVAVAAAGVPVPFSGNAGSASFSIEGRPSPPGDPGPHGDIGYVTPQYFAAMKIPLRSGRTFTDQDQRTTQKVAMIDETLAREYWPNENPIGQHIRLGSNAPWATIIGVAGHAKNSDLSGDTVKGKYYFPVYQVPPPFMTFVVRTQTQTDPARFGAAITAAVRAEDPTLPVSNMKTLSDMVASSLAARRFVVTLLGVFASMALLMAVLGLYGVISYSVTQRTQEIGIRMALGAERGAVLGLVIRQGMLLAGIGAIIGLVVSLTVNRLLRNVLFGVSAFDPLTFAAMALVLIGAAFAASYVPARRALRVDPIQALRYE